MFVVTAFPHKIGFIGAGRMATALARGCLQAELVPPEKITAADPFPAALESFAGQVAGAKLSENNAAVLGQSEVVVLAVKPQMMAGVLSDIKPHVEPKHILVSIAAGITLAKLAAGLPENTRLIRVMPNTPCLVGLGASCYCRGPSANAEDADMVRQILGSVGEAYEVEEPLLDAVTGLSGSGPAFIYRVIESLAAGGAAEGLDQKLALRLAALTARGAAEMVLTTGQSPAELREQVTSPGGTTLAGLEVLEAQQGPQAFAAAVEAATNRSKELAGS